LFNPFLLLCDTRLDLLLDDGLGLAHFFPFGNRLDAVGLEEVYETPTVVGTGGWRLITHWARHLNCRGAFILA